MKMNKDIFNLIEAALKMNKIKVIEYVKKISLSLKNEGNFKDAQYLIDIIGNNDTIFSATNDEKFLIVEKINKDYEILWKNNKLMNQIINLLKNEEKIKIIGVFKTLLYGKPGIGKTTFVYDIAKIMNKKLLQVKASKLVSSKLGETQKNIELLLIDINNNYYDSIFLLDEFDSLIGTRNNDINDEYKRMIGTFNMILDNLPKGTILFAISNIIDNIDSATIRRFNIKIQMDEIDINLFEKVLFKKANNNNIILNNKSIIKLLNKNIDKLNYGLIDSFITFALLFDCNLQTAIVNQLNINNELTLNSMGLTDKEIAEIIGKSSSTVNRRLRKNVNI